MAEEGRSRGLGRGLSALIGDDTPLADPPGARGYRKVPVAFLKPNRFQPRQIFRDEDLDSLAASIREKGVLQPILVRPASERTDRFEIVAGERRWRAAQRAQLHEVPVVVREMDDGEALELAIVENVQRSDLNAIEEATGYQDLIGRFGYTQEQLAKEIGKSRSHIANTIRLLRLPDGVKAMIADGRLTAGHARTLVGVADPEARAREIVEGLLTVREAEKARPRIKRAPNPKDADTRALEDNLTNTLGLHVAIAHKGEKGGTLTIRYRTLEQLDDLCRRLSNGGGKF